MPRDSWFLTCHWLDCIIAVDRHRNRKEVSSLLRESLNPAVAPWFAWSCDPADIVRKQVDVKRLVVLRGAIDKRDCRIYKTASHFGTLHPSDRFAKPFCVGPDATWILLAGLHGQWKQFWAHTYQSRLRTRPLSRCGSECCCCFCGSAQPLVGLLVCARI